MICGGFFDIDRREHVIRDLEHLTTAADFWLDNLKAQKTMQDLSAEKTWVESWQSLHAETEDMQILLQMSIEEKDEASLQSVSAELESLDQRLTRLELKAMFTNPEDRKTAILTIHPGAGGTESQDWAEMLMRMYQRWSVNQGFRWTAKAPALKARRLKSRASTLTDY